MKKFLFLLFYFQISSSIFSQTHTLNTIYVNSDVDIMPSYPGGESEVYQLISESFHVNQKMKQEVGTSIQVIIANFIIDSVGNISDIRFLESNSTLIVLELIKIFQKMPVWTPGYKDGKAISIRVYIPIKFIINDSEFFIISSGPEMVVGNAKSNRGLKYTLIGLAINLMFLFITGRLRI